ncbi:MAG: cell wall-binding repeat-containing protein, partial [Eggerthellaceae bacterium]|nr:cell wall-binding repeat-containing protein [Eggerthellaceae bacterium]
AILAGLENNDEEIDLYDYSVDQDEASEVYYEVLFQNPQFFYVATECMSFYDETGRVHYFLPAYMDIPPDELAQYKAKYKAALDDLLSWVPSNASNVNKVKAVHDWLVRKCAYDTEAAEYGPDVWGYNAWTAYGALVDGYAVCQGYSLAFIAAMNKLGFEATYVTQADHGWNRVCVNGKWYNVDVTFDDPIVNGRDLGPYATPSTEFFMKSDKWFKAHPTQGVHTAWTPAGVAGTDTTYDEYDWPTYSGSANSSSSGSGSSSSASSGSGSGKSSSSGSSSASSSGASSGSSSSASGSSGSAVPSGKPARLGGKDAYDTMKKIVSKGFSKCDVAVIATFDGYWDALAASSLAGVYDAPVLLTDTNKLSQECLDELRALNVKRAIIVGGPAAVSKNVESKLDQLGYNPSRLYGNTALETATAIAGAVGNMASDTCVIATSNGYWDALAASPYAYSTLSPIFLTRDDGVLTDAVLAKIKAGGFKRAVIAGGTTAVKASAETKLKALGIEPVRCNGKDAYETAIKLAKWEIGQGMSANGMGIATINGYWDALTGSALCGTFGSVLVLADDDNVSAIEQVMQPNKAKISTYYIFGGTAAVGTKVEKKCQSVVGI